jgi:hypothetical protein
VFVHGVKRMHRDLIYNTSTRLKHSLGFLDSAAVKRVAFGSRRLRGRSATLFALFLHSHDNPSIILIFSSNVT